MRTVLSVKTNLRAADVGAFKGTATIWSRVSAINSRQRRWVDPLEPRTDAKSIRFVEPRRMMMMKNEEEGEEEGEEGEEETGARRGRSRQAFSI